GDGTTYDRTTPVMVKKPADAPADFTCVQVSAGYDFSLALGSNGYAYGWGCNELGQIGDGTAWESDVPVRVRDPANPTDTSKGLQAVQVSAGVDHSLAVGSDGYAWAWGCNLYGQLGNNGSDYKVHSVPVRVRDPVNPTDPSKGLKDTRVSAGDHHSLAVGSNGYTYGWGNNEQGQIGDGTNDDSSVPVLVKFNVQRVITRVKFDSKAISAMKRGDDGSVIVLTPAHQPGTVTVSVDYTLGGAPQKPDTSLRYTYLPAGVLPKAGGEGILLALATGITGMGGVLASRRHRKETHSLSHASHE
ncbi:chromosome condensation regulator RCC1, partial [Bifidobacterium sp. H1HS16N]|nr:chromosome condensation regulator RCC1 [Bifidobacterium sp. H1HS16N]